MLITAQAAQTAANWSAGTSVKYQAAFWNLAGYIGNWRNWSLASDRTFVPLLVISFITSTDRVGPNSAALQQFHAISPLHRKPPTREERPITPPKVADSLPYGWSPDGKWLLTSRRNASTGRTEIWAVPTTADVQSGIADRKVISDPAYDLYQSHFSPDGRWIVFEATSPTGFESTIYVISASGGPWIRITDGKHWDDKPRWSPDGKLIYSISGRSGFYNVFGVHFNPAKKDQGIPFSVTRFDSPGFMIPKQIMAVELSLTQDRLVVTVAEVSGNIWVLDNLDR